MSDKYSTFGCLGRARFGKGTMADIIKAWCHERDCPVQIISFADPIKDFLTTLVGRSEPFRGNDAERNAPVPELPWVALSARVQAWGLKLGKDLTGCPTGRELMQVFGSEIIRDQFCYDAWARIASNRARLFNGVTVVDDVRFPNEAVPRREGGMFDYVFKVVRPGWPLSDHKSEKAVDEVPDRHIDATFINDSDIPALARNMIDWLERGTAKSDAATG